MNRALQKHLQFVNSHVGHTITYGYANPQTGKVLRANIREDIEAVRVYLEGRPFPIQIYSDEITACECQGTATEGLKHP